MATAEADSAPSVLTRVKKLEKQVAFIKRYGPDVYEGRELMPPLPGGPGFWHGEATCPHGAPVGGGVDWIGPTISREYRIIESYPTVGGWTATTYSPDGTRSVVYVRCV